MDAILKQLKEYFDNTPRDVIESEWRKYDKYNEIGPTVREYLVYVSTIFESKPIKPYKISGTPSFYSEFFICMNVNI